MTTYYKPCDEAIEIAGGESKIDPRDWLCECRGGFLALGLVPVAAGALLIEDGESLRGPILDLVANELLTVEAAAAEIMRLLYCRGDHVHWFVPAMGGERCEKCGRLRAAVGEQP